MILAIIVRARIDLHFRAYCSSRLLRGSDNETAPKDGHAGPAFRA
jgi:hypothetical protein